MLQRSLPTLLAIASCLLGAYALKNESRLKQLDAHYLDEPAQPRTQLRPQPVSLLR